MAKSKYAPALFEVIGKKDEKPSGGLSLPKWWQSRGTSATPAKPAQNQLPAQAGDAAPGDDSSEDIPVPPAGPDGIPSGATAVIVEASKPDSAIAAPAVPASAVPQPLAAPASAGTLGSELDDEPPPPARVRAGRVELSLNPTNTAIVAGVLILTLFLCYELGRGFRPSARTGPQTTEQAGDLQDIRNSRPDPSVLAAEPTTPTSERTSPRSPTAARAAVHDNPAPKARVNTPTPPPAVPPHPPVAASPSGTIERTPGLTYVVLETLKQDDKDEAEQIRQWLKSKHDIDTTVEPAGDNWQLVSTQGYDYNKESDKQKAEGFRSIIQKLGKEYKAEFRSKARYDMRSPGLRKFH